MGATMGGYAANTEWSFQIGHSTEEIGGWKTSHSEYGQFDAYDRLGVLTDGEQGYSGWRGQSRGGSRGGFRNGGTHGMRGWNDFRGMGAGGAPPGNENPFYASDN